MARRSEHTRQQLKALAIDAATRLAMEQGITGLTARKIAADIGYTPGTLYLVFENLDELILYVNAQSLDTIYDAMQSVLKLTKDPTQGVKNLVSAYLEFVNDNRGLWSCLYEHRPEAIKIPEWYIEKVKRNFELLEKAMAQVSCELRHKQNLDVSKVSDANLFENVMVLPATSTTADLNAVQLAARALWCAVHGVCMLSLSSSLSVAGVDSMLPLVNHLTDASLQSLAS